MARRKRKEAEEAKEPGIFLRVSGYLYSTLLWGAGGFGVLVVWNMLDTRSADRDIPTAMYVYLGVALAVLAFCGVLRALFLPQLQIVWHRRRMLKEAKALTKELARGLRYHRARVAEPQQAELEEARKALVEARKARDWDALQAAIKALDDKLDAYLAFARKSTPREYVESIGVAVLIALLLRSFVVEAFRIPSGSMIPTLQVGDHIFVNKFIYGVRIPWTDHKIGMGVRKPQRGEVIVFKFPRDPDKDFIKRIVGIEGDTVEVRDNALYINERPVSHTPITTGECSYEDKLSEESERWEHRECNAFRETLDRARFTTIYDRPGAARSWPPVKVPAGHVFVMGDNRDNSHDSRYWGFVPFANIKGRAMFIWWSSGQPEGIRLGRMGKSVE